MITLTIIGIIVLVIIFTVICLAGGFVVIFLDPIIAVLLIWLVVKLIKRIKRKS